MIHSLRAFGYDLGMAIADLIDNSIFAEASNIWLSYDWNNGDPWVALLDDGRGMSETKLVEAMRLGTQSPLERRDKADLGRFGLGLKTASFSQCKLLFVRTKQKGGDPSIRYWDLDHVEQTREWQLGRNPPKDIHELLQPLDNLEHGTIVVWKALDRIVDHNITDRHHPKDAFLGRFLSIKKYLEMVFHRYLERRTKRIKIKIGIGECIAWDPFLLRNNFTRELSSERHEDSRVKVVPYVLPHISNRSAFENDHGGGIKGWNAQQGFYVYRNDRMIVSGGYLDLDLKPEEHYKLARISIDITNDMDHEWSIDVRKAVASPPDRLRNELLRIARATRQKASEIYRARTGARRRRFTTSATNDVWLKREAEGKIIYKINSNNPVLVKLLAEIEPPRGWTRKLFHTLESTVPHRLIIMDGIENEDCHVDLPETLYAPPPGLVDYCREIYLDKLREGRSHEEAVDIVCSIEPFDFHPSYRAALDSFAEGRN